MLKSGIYEYKNTGVRGGYFRLRARETANTIVLQFVESTIKYDAPQLDDMFCVLTGKHNKVVLKKEEDGTRCIGRHYCEIGGDWFIIAPYRLGTPHYFEIVEDGDNGEG